MLFDFTDMTEADDAAGDDRDLALRNAREKWRAYKAGEETYGVYSMYEATALSFGWPEVDIKKGE